MPFVLAVAPLPAQPSRARLPTPGVASAAPWVMERMTRDRWMHGRQLPRFSPFASDRASIAIDSLRDGTQGRTLHLTLGRSAYGRDSARVVIGAGGHVAELHAGFAPFVRRGAVFPGDSARYMENQRHPFRGNVSLVETRVWDLVPGFPDTAPSIGSTWTDTIARVATDGPFRQALHGTRTSRLVGDTVVDGRRLWVVRDTAVVHYEEEYPEHERTLDATVRVSRVADGTMRGVHLYDPQLRLFRWRADTTRLTGDAELRYPDGRSFHTPARYDRMREWTLYDAAAYAARLAALRAAATRSMGGMVRVPTNELERRLAAGDRTVRDSLVAEWQRTSDPDDAHALFGRLMAWNRDARWRATLDSMRIAAGDTAYLYQRLADRAGMQDRPLGVADARLMLPFMRDPSIAWALNLSRDWLYENLVQALTTWPRAAAIDPGRERLACTLAACRILGAQRTVAHESRLRDVALVALVSIDPRRWADTVLALDGPGRPLLHLAARLAMGVGTTWDAASKAPLPPPNSDARAWLEWMNGVSPEYARTDTAVAAMLGRPAASALPQVRFEESHVTAIRFYTARTGRDVVRELRRGYAGATADSVRLVFGTMLQGLDELRMDEAEIADAFSSGATERIQLARRALVSRFNGPTEPMSPADAAPIVDRLLAATIDTAPLWRLGAADLYSGRRGIGPTLHARVGRVLLDAAHLPDVIRARWAGRAEIITSADWNRRDPREGGVFYTVHPIRTWGRFARVELTASERNARSQSEAPAQYASGRTYYLMRLDDEWVIVAEEGWVT